MDIDSKKNKTSQYIHLFFHEMHKSDKTIKELTTVIINVVLNTELNLKNHAIPGSRKQVNYTIFLIHDKIYNGRLVLQIKLKIL